MSALPDPQHDQFARLLASGSSLIDAYHLVYPEVPRSAASDKASCLAHRPEVEARLAELAEENADEAIWSLADRLAFLRDIVLLVPDELNFSSPHCAGLRWTSTGPEYKMYDKLSALALYSKLAGDLGAPIARPATPPPAPAPLLPPGALTETPEQRQAAGPILENLRHERFAQLVGRGERASYAYEKIYGICRANARVEAYRLTQRPEIADRIAAIRQAAAALVGWTSSQRLKYLRALVESPLGDLDETSPYCQGFHRDKNGGPKVKIPNKLRAITLYSRLVILRQSTHPQTIEQITTQLRLSHSPSAAEAIESSLLTYLAGPELPEETPLAA